MLSVKVLSPLPLVLLLACASGKATAPRQGTPSTPEAPAAASPAAQPGQGATGAAENDAPLSVGAPTNGAPSNAAVGAAPPASQAAALPKGTTVLHIGDSFAGALGLDLNRELKAAGVHSVLKYQTSSYIPGWASGKEIELYLANYNPDLVLVTLGANELQIPDPQERVRTIHKLVSRIGQRPCVWIGPPLWQGARPALLEVIRAECAPCLYLDSTAHLPNLARARDGIHPSGPARTEWAALVVHWLSEHRDPNGTRPWSLRGSE
jgi:lysophospholipase L1-like esterase